MVRLKWIYLNNTIKPTKFQFLNGAIKILNIQPQAFRSSYFNSLMVRLKFSTFSHTNRCGSYFNSLMVRLKLFLRPSFQNLLAYFNSLMVRLKYEDWQKFSEGYTISIP